jgi:hypothetical protein
MNIKLKKEKEIILIPKYMSKEFEEIEGQHFEYEGMNFYLIKSNTGSWCITEKITRKFIVTWRKTRKQAFVEFENFMNEHLLKVKDHINNLNTVTV